MARVNRLRERASGSIDHSCADENVLSFIPLSTRDGGSTALNLVYQAADVFRGIEDQARETEARARSLCKSAVERLKLADERVESAERAQRETIHEG